MGGHLRALEIRVDSGIETGNIQLTLEAAMASMRQAEAELKVRWENLLRALEKRCKVPVPSDLAAAIAATQETPEQHER